MDAETRGRIARATRLAGWLDTAFRIPGTRIRIGFDPLLGLLPGLGDAIAALVGGFIVWTALRAGAPRPVVVRMLGNVALDAIVGAIPLLGTVFDVVFKAHQRNARLLSDWADQPSAVEARQVRVMAAFVFLVVALLAIAVAAAAFGIWALVRLVG